ncbi:MAG: hypothetical protein Q8N53_12985 [Longimicrobiales bacterium]|nr:hypothetical protein [Longimicrobiales bacterium]
MSDVARCHVPHNLASLRRQVALMAHVRDTVVEEDTESALRWMHALVDLTDELLTELGAAEREACPGARTTWPTTEAGPGAHWWERIIEVAP